MDTRILSDNQKKRITLSLPILFCYSIFSSWQMGVIFFSGTALSIDGKTPLPINIDSTTLIIVLGYLCSVIFLIFIPKICVSLAKVVITLCLVLVLAIYLPLPAAFQAILFYGTVFCCVFLIGITISITVNLFTEKTEIRDVLIGTVTMGVFVGILQNEIRPLPFSIFQAFTVVAMLMILFSLYQIPTHVWPEYINKKTDVPCPKKIFVGVYLLVGLSCIMALFGNTVSETIKNGVSIYYFSAALFALIVVGVWKIFKIHPLISAPVFIGLSVLGFVIAIISLNSPELAPLACIFIGGNMTLCNMSAYFGIALSKRYPSKYITPMIIALALTTVILHSALLEAFRDRVGLLYAVYTLICVFASLIYIILEPNLIYSMKREAPLSYGNITQAAYGSDFSKAEDEPQEIRPEIFRSLSSQEWTMTQLILQGYTNPEIAEEMKISPETGKTYRKNIYSKLYIHSKRELFQLANRQQL